jgi:hypothetical protein
VVDAVEKQEADILFQGSTYGEFGQNVTPEEVYRLLSEISRDARRRRD